MLITVSVSADCRSYWGASGHHRGAGAGMEQSVDKHHILGDQTELGVGLHSSSQK